MSCLQKFVGHFMSFVFCYTGSLKCTLSKHRGVVFSLMWSPTNEYIVSGSSDETAIVWDVKAEEKKQLFAFHKGSLLNLNALYHR